MRSGGIPDMTKILEDAAARLKVEGRRCEPDELYWYAFPQTWGSTALGFGGIGGQCMTSAQTIVVLTCSAPIGAAAVYFGGRFAYQIQNAGDKFSEALINHSFPPVSRAGSLERKP